MENGATDISRGLHLAAQTPDMEILKYLLEKGADINTERQYDGQTALHIACDFGYLDIVTFLTEKNADLVIFT